MKELLNIKKENKDLEVAFDFLARIRYKMIKVSSEEKHDNSITFVDYIDDAKYYVDIEKANRIIDYCYSEYFFKVVLSGTNFYNKVKKISLDLEIEPPVFDLFFKSLFFAIKNRYNYPDYSFFSEHYFYKTIYEAPLEAFESVTQIDSEYFIKKTNIILTRLIGLGLINVKERNVTCDSRLELYFKISCNTFKFYIISPSKAIEQGYESFSRIFEYLDLKTYLNVQDYLNVDLLTKLDKVVQMLVLISIKDESNVRFFNNEYSDNSYIKKLNSDRNAIIKNK